MNTLDLLVVPGTVMVWLASAGAALACGYLLLLTLCSAALRLPPVPAPRLRFAVVVPAHDESGGIARTVASLSALAWPRELLRIVVVADNCTDDTAARARAAGAEVLERHDPARRGKGHALDFAFAALAAEGWADALVVVDADSRADTSLLHALSASLASGARAVQVHYAVDNAQDSWRTRLMAIAMAAFHDVRSRARERLGLSCGIRGNGWCVTRELLAAVPYNAYSVVEDVEYGARLGLAGVRVAYCEAAAVRAAMVSQAANAAPQRRRWELGRRELRRTLTPPLLRRALHGDPVCLDLAADLLVPPLAQLVAWTLAAALAAALLNVRDALLLDMAALGSLMLYVGRGWQLSGLGWTCALDFLRVPWFIAWKLGVLLRQGAGGWTRTQREPR